MVASRNRGPADSSVRDEIVAAASVSEARRVAVEYLRGQLAQVLGTGIDNIQPNSSLNQIGLDSLLAVELANRIKSINIYKLHF